MIETLTIIFKFMAATAGLFIASMAFITGYHRYWTARKKRKILEDEISSKFVSQFNKDELDGALSGYVVPHCSPSDPTNRDGEEYFADTRESVFNYLDRTIKYANRSYNLLLSDTGMGKTSLCLNYYSHARRRFPDLNFALISLAAGDALSILKSIDNKSNCALIADALDEDPDAIDRGRERLSEILTEAADFKFVLITCRSQFFVSDDAIPRETPLTKLIPRELGQSPNHALVRTFISPFDKIEINKYISKHFPWHKPWKIGSRLRAVRLAQEIPDLAYRPMLLERLPDIVVKGENSRELFDLYKYMVDGWIAREAKWISQENLSAASNELALYIYERYSRGLGRISLQEVNSVVEDRLGSLPDWQHLSSRSLLNRDSQGRFKFAHKSILEYLVVNLAIGGDNRALASTWTPFMRELFISWGHSSAGQEHPHRAHEILSSAQGRSSVSPLYDSWASPPTSSAPDFKRSAERRFSHTGSRLAPSSWRAASVQISAAPQKSGWIISDHEFNLEWLLIDAKFYKMEGISETLSDILTIKKNNRNYSLPSYDQFISLIEATSSLKKQIIPQNEFFLIADKPEARSYLLVSLGKIAKQSSFAGVMDKGRVIAGTKSVVNCYVTGMHIQPDFAQKIKVRQLWLLDR